MGVVVAAVAAAVVVGAIAAPVAPQELAGVRFTWEVNFTTVVLAVGAVIGWWLTLKRQGDKVAEHAQTIETLKLELARKVESNAIRQIHDSVESLVLRAVKLEHDHTAFKEEVYKDYLSGDAIREIKNEIRDDISGTEKRMMAAFKDLSERVSKGRARA